MSDYYDHDDDYTEWEDECNKCFATFTNQGLHGIPCPHCEEDDDDDND